MTAENKQAQPAGETKTIRYEKGGIHPIGSLWFIPEVAFYQHFLYKAFSGTDYVCVKSFTLQINIIEDKTTHNYLNNDCKHPDIGTDGGGDYCKRCGHRF
ncbi:hypothetical protein AAHN97_15085 [Chitinophaga niabensis]|uniref:hypothetical protein n=1 Tax=Chitinophaga niabensis TaxID=536979 RepID=UPI0031BA1DA3